MSTTVADIRGWLKAAKKEGATHVIVMCDTFDYEDYPVSVMPNEDAREKAKEYSAKSMQRVMEVYNLKMDLESQLSSKVRTFNY